MASIEYKTGMKEEGRVKTGVTGGGWERTREREVKVEVNTFEIQPNEVCHVQHL